MENKCFPNKHPYLNSSSYPTSDHPPRLSPALSSNLDQKLVHNPKLTFLHILLNFPTTHPSTHTYLFRPYSVLSILPPSQRSHVSLLRSHRQ